MATNKLKTNINKEFNRPPRRIFDTQRAQRTNTKTRKMIFTARVAKEAKDAKKTLEIFSFIKVCFYYKVFKHSNTEK